MAEPEGMRVAKRRGRYMKKGAEKKKVGGGN